MSILTPSTTPTLAERAAANNFESNLRVLRDSQPALVALVSSVSLDGEWLFGRDGSLTARESSGRWLAGCSLPLRAAREMLRPLDVKGTVACFLAPTHAAQIAAGLECMRPEQAIIALVPEVTDLAAMLHCQDFSQDLRSHRLWFVSGVDWQRRMRDLFVSHTGLATPAQFIRVPASDPDLIERLVPAARAVISEITAQRASLIQALRTQSWRRPEVTRLCVVAPTRFRLWNDPGEALNLAANSARGDDFTITLYDADDPASSAPLALVQTARECSALLTVNTARCDLPGMLPDEMPWITWVTTGRIPAFSSAGPNDHLILIDENWIEPSQRAGWPQSRIHLGGWPNTLAVESDPQAQAELVIVADTFPLDPPQELTEYSSHTLLWDAIRRELLGDPFSLGADVNTYLNSRMQELQIEADTFPRGIFINRLIVSAYQQGLARMLMREGVRLRAFGEGWDTIDEFASVARGPVESRLHLEQILGESRALVHIWPTRQAHPVDRLAIPVVRPMGMRPTDFLSIAKHPPLKPSEATINVPPLSGALLRKILC